MASLEFVGLVFTGLSISIINYAIVLRNQQKSQQHAEETRQVHSTARVIHNTQLWEIQDMIKQGLLFILLVVLLSANIPTTRASNVDFTEPIHKLGWNLISGSGYYEGETITLKFENSTSQYVDIGTVKAGEDGSWLLYFSIEDINYWSVESGEYRILIIVFSSRGIPKRLFLSVSDDLDRSIFPPRGYFKTPVYPENRIISDILWKQYIYPDVSSSLYREVFMKRVLTEWQFYKNMHYNMRD